jgi:excisionase family DNA binding protein
LYNSETKERIKDDEGVIANCNWSYFNLVNEKHNFSFFLDYYVSDFHTEIGHNFKSESITNGSVSFHLKNAIDVEIIFSSPNYENSNYECIFCRTYQGQWFSINTESPLIEEAAKWIAKNKIPCGNSRSSETIPLYLIPKRTILGGTLNVKIEKDQNQDNSEINSNQENDADLGLFSSKEIAQKLRVPEEEILKLIRNGELKAKKIGTQFFIRKEDFDEYMKK